MADTLIELEGCDGGLITLIGPGKGTQGVWLAEGDIEYLIEQPVETIYNSHAFQIGADYGGDRMPPRELSFALEVFGTPTMSAEEAAAGVQRALSTLKDAKLWYETSESRRWLTVRLRENLRFQVEQDPGRRQYVRIVVSLIAADPHWYEKSVTHSWEATAATSSGTLHIPNANPTPNPIWAQYIVQAHTGAKWTIPDHSFGDDRFGRGAADVNRQIVMPALIAGEHLLIDTSDAPKHPQVVSNIDTQVYLRMNGVEFLYPIPARTGELDLPVAVTNADAGVGIQIRLPRPWPSAFGGW